MGSASVDTTGSVAIATIVVDVVLISPDTELVSPMVDSVPVVVEITAASGVWHPHISSRHR